MVERPFEQAHQPLDLLAGVVHSRQHDVLEHELASRAAHVTRARGEQRGQRVRAVQGHQTTAQLVGGRVQAHRQVHLQRFARQAIDAGHYARGRHGDGARRQTYAAGVVQQTAGAQCLFVVVERLTHTHEHDVGDPPLLGLRAAHEAEDLVDDLLGAQAAAQTGAAGRTERAADGTAHLSRDAHGHSPPMGHEHRFYRLSVCGPQKRLDRASARRLARLDLLEKTRTQPRRELLAQRARELAHVREAGGQSLGERLVHLTRAIRRLAQFFHGALERGQIDHRPIVLDGVWPNPATAGIVEPGPNVYAPGSKSSRMARAA